jgi:raffinose/stachyose/melibiose transport system substrate-binding protein
MSHFKRIFLLVVVLVLVTGAFGVTSAQEDVVITWWNIQTVGEQQAVWEQVEADFEAANPGVDVQRTVLENEAFKTQLVTVMQAGDPPDLFQSWGGGPLWAFADAGLVRDISGALDANDGEWRDSFLSSGALGLWGRGEEQYGVPFNFGPVGLWYNKALMEELGFDPDNPWDTWEDFINVIETIQAETDIAPIAVGEGEKWPGHFWFAYLALRLGGQEAYIAAGDRTGAFTDEPFVEAYQYIVDLVDMGAFQEGFLGMGYADAAAMVPRGEAAMQLMGTWDPPTALDACDCEGLGDDLGWETFPAIEDGAGNATDVFGGGDGFAVGANAPDETIELLKYITSPEIQALAAENIGILPTINEAPEIVSDNPYADEWLTALEEATVIQSFLDQFYPPALGEAVNDTVETVFAGAATPEEAAAELEAIAAFELD